MADIGATLRETRMRAKIDINEVEARTKIRAKYLRAIENEEWDLLPGEVYARTFVRTYADFLGLDSRQLLDEFRRRHAGAPEHDPRPISPQGRDRDRRRGRDPGRSGRLIPPWALVGAVLLVVLALLWFVGNLGNKKPTTSVQTGARTGIAGKHHTRHSARHTTPLLHTPARARTVKLQLTPTSTVWVCLVDGAGRKLIPGQTYAPGQSVPTEHSSKLLLTLGNAGVQMKVDGRTVNVPPSSTPIGFEFLPGGRTRALTAAQQPRCA